MAYISICCYLSIFGIPLLLRCPVVTCDNKIYLRTLLEVEQNDCKPLKNRITIDYTVSAKNGKNKQPLTTNTVFITVSVSPWVKMPIAGQTTYYHNTTYTGRRPLLDDTSPTECNGICHNHHAWQPDWLEILVLRSQVDAAAPCDTRNKRANEAFFFI